MKIYTKINYKWLDGQLVKTSSKSFEYEGDLTLCGGGGGGGKGGGGGGDGGTLGAMTSSVSDTVSDVVTDPVGTTQDILSDTAETVGGSIAEGADIAGQNIQTGVEMAGDNLDAGVSGIGMNEGVATTLGDMGANIDTNMAPLVAEGNRWTDAAVTNLQYGSEFLGEKMGEVSDFLGYGSSPSDVTIDPDKFAVDSSKKKKNKSDLAVNKAKKRSRSSLRIG